MKLLRAHIFGFGKWVDYTFDFQNASFLCFYGKNEAGKSTLQQFIFYMLFGLPPRKLALYKPKFSSRIGGTLTVDFPELGEVTIERVENEFRLLLPDGKTDENEGLLQEQLHHLRKETYEAIYGFSALDLTRLHEMKATELSDLLFSVGLTGSTSIYEVERKLERRLGEMFKKSGTKPLINEQITKVYQLEKQLSKAKQEVLSYRDKVNELHDYEMKLAQIYTTLERKREAFSLLEKINQFFPQIRTYMDTKQQLSKYHEFDLTFAEDGISRYETLKERLIPLEAERNTLKTSLDDFDKTISELEENLLPKNLYNEIEQLIAKKPIVDQKYSAVHQLKNEMERIQREIDDDLATLNITEEIVESFEAPFYLEAEWKQLYEEEKRLRLEKEHILEERSLLEQKQQQLFEEQKQLEENFIGFARLKKLQEAIGNREKTETERSTLATLLKWEKDRNKQSRLGLFVTSLMMMIVFSISFFQQNSVIAIIGTALLFIVLIQAFFYRKNIARINELNKKMNSLQQIYEIDEAVNMNEQERLADNINQLLQSLKNVQMELLQVDEKQHHFEIKEQKFVSRITDERLKFPFLQTIDVAYWVEYLQQLMEVQAKRKKRDELANNVKNLTEELDGFTKMLNQLSTEMGFIDQQISFSTLEKIRKNQDTIIQQRQNYDDLKNDAEARFNLLQEEIVLLNKQIHELFSYCHVQDQESFYQKARNIEEKAQLDEVYEKLHSQLISVFSGERLHEIEKENLDIIEIERDLSEIQSEIHALDKEKTTIQQHITKLQLEIKQLELSDDFSYMTHLFEKERERLNSQANRWAKLKLASALLRQAKHRYQEKYLHDVIDYTSQFFAHLTNDRYVAVYKPTKSNSFQVEDKDKIRYTVEELSKGTIDQLYVALRFAISKVMSEKFVIPLMIDDAFIHFDDERALRAIQLLEKISHNQQVILFTCRTYIADVVNKANSLRIDI